LVLDAQAGLRVEIRWENGRHIFRKAPEGAFREHSPVENVPFFFQSPPANWGGFSSGDG
jgi:hypothetical protein